MNPGTTRTVMLGLAAAALILMAGCASESSSRRDQTSAAYETDVDRATATIAEAEQEGASEHGSEDLNRARDKLNSALRAAQAGDEVAAQRLAVEADLDARVAMAAQRNGEAQAAVNELNESIQTLEDELRRNEQRGYGSERF